MINDFKLMSNPIIKALEIDFIFGFGQLYGIVLALDLQLIANSNGRQITEIWDFYYRNL